MVNEKTSATAAAPVKTLQATFTRPFQCHGSLGPSCAVAQWQGGKLTVWTHSQGVYPLRADLAKVFALDPANVHCIHTEGAGCYGHNGADDVALDAALVARATKGRPVKLQWMRDDEFAWEPYGSAMVMQLSGGLDAQATSSIGRHDVWSHPHNNRPGPAEGVNLLASWYLEQPFKPPARPTCRSPPAAPIAMRSRCTIFRTRKSSNTFCRRCRCAPPPCARSAAMPMCSPWNRSSTSWRWQPTPIQWSSGYGTCKIRARGR